MKKKLATHSMLLIVILLASFATFYLAQGARAVQMIAAVFTTIAYIIWGIRYHAIAGELHRTIVIEYILVGFIAITLLVTLAM